MTTPALAVPFEVKITLRESDDDFQDHMADEEKWKGNDEGEYTKTFEVKQLPWSIEVSRTTFKIDSQGAVSASYEYGDTDGTVNGKMRLPMVNGKFVLTDHPCELILGGGDQASGVWGMEATVVVKPLK